MLEKALENPSGCPEPSLKCKLPWYSSNGRTDACCYECKKKCNMRCRCHWDYTCPWQKREAKCSLITKYGDPGEENGKCVGFSKSDENDEPTDKCMECSKNIFYEGEEK